MKTQSEIIHGDCLVQLQKMEANSIDAVITDPPYCSGGFTEAAKTLAQKQGVREHRIEEIEWFPSDNMTTVGIRYLIRELCLELDRVMKQNTSLLMFTDWRMVVNLVPVIESCGFQYRSLVVWDKNQMGLGNGFRPQHEIIMHFVKGKAIFHTKNVGNVLNIKRVKTKNKLHQTEKPTELLKKLLEVVTKAEDTVLDPFCGSGSMAETCLKMHRNFVGIEKAQVHFLTAKKRTEQVKTEIENNLFSDLNDTD
jgi:DNA modification methylase